MRFNTAKILQKATKQIFELWMKTQLVDFSLREELMSNGISPRETGML